MKNNMEYQKLYDEFMQKYKQSETTPTEAGETLARIAGYFPSYNLAMVRAERDFAKIHAKIAEETDESTGKSMSSSKAEVLADASSEAFAFKEARGHVANIELLIRALKFLQKSLEIEYTNSNL